MNAARVADLGAGRSLAADSGPDEIGQAIGSVLEDPAYRTNARSLAGQIDALGKGEGLVGALEALV